MREPSRILASATAILLLATAVPASATPAGSASARPPMPRIFHAVLHPDPDPGCDDPRQPTGSPTTLDWWRRWWNAATSHRVTRQPETRQSAHAPFYLRSPMMSGFFGWDDREGCDDRKRATVRSAPPPHASPRLPVKIDTVTTDSTPDQP